SPFVREIFGRRTWIFSVAIGIVITAIIILVDVERATLKMLRKLGVIHEEQLKQQEDKSSKP
ncbi:MAG: hypothetical protein QW145_04065, partial [Candidatus Bathyarchaeia archaeon]